jgi:hypothetical protein
MVKSSPFYFFFNIFADILMPDFSLKGETYSAPADVRLLTSFPVRSNYSC